MVRKQLTHLHLPGWLLQILLLGALLSGCSSSPVAPAAGSGIPTDAGRSETPQSTSDTSSAAAPAVPTAPKPDTHSATLALLQQSQQAEGTGSLNEAIAYTERAIRISPRQADLWNRLASLELANGQPASAIQYANKALTLAGTRSDWQRQAWLIIADAKDAQGNHAEAADIRERWQTYRG